MQRRQISGIDLYLYDTVEEFRKYYPTAELKYWEDPTVEAEDYIETSEGGVTKCMKVGILQGRRFITTIMGTFRVGTKMDNVIRKNYAKFVAKDGTQGKSGRLSLATKQMGRFMLMGMDKHEAFKKAFPDAKSEEYVKQRTSIITNRKQFGEFMSKEFTKLLTESGMTKQWALDIEKGIAENDKAPAAVRLEIAEKVINDHGERLKEVTTTEHRWNASHQISEGEMKQLDKINISAKQEEKKPIEQI